MKLRRIIFWIHLIVGASVGSVILLLSATGMFLAFQPQLLSLAESNVRTVYSPSAETNRLSLDDLVFKALEKNPADSFTGLTLKSAANASLEINLGRDKSVFVNPYTGEVLGSGATSFRKLFVTVTHLHRWFALEGKSREVAKTIKNACNLLFLFLVISGIYLWWPRSVKLFKSGLKGAARDWNWHNVFGFWSSPVLLVIILTGLIMSYQWANNLLYTLTGNEAPPPKVESADKPSEKKSLPSAESRPSFNIDNLFAQVFEKNPQWTLINLRMPQRSEAPVTFFIQDTQQWLSKARSQLAINPETMKIVKWEPYSEYNWGKKLRTWARYLHTGEALGVPGQVLTFLASGAAVMLVWTGFAMAWRRFRK